MKKIVLLVILFSIVVLPQTNHQLQSLAKEFFRFRTIEQPITPDDVPRVERPDGWLPDYSAKAINNYNKMYKSFKDSLANLSMVGWSRKDSVDYLLLHSAIERVNWELNVLKLPERDPDFYIQQTLGAVFDLLVISSPMNQNRINNIIIRLNSIPKTINDAEQNLTEPVSAFANIALEELNDVGNKLKQTEKALQKYTSPNSKAALHGATEKAIKALENYQNWIEKNKSTISNNYSVGRKGYEYFLKNVALIPYSPEQILSMGHLEFNRAVAFDEIENVRDAKIPKAKIFPTIEDQIKQAKKDEKDIREFLVEKNIMSVPKWVMHYEDRPIPAYVLPLSDVGETDDFTSPTRLDENAVRYIPPPSPKLPFFLLASAEDPRPIIVHEGVPGHYFQLVRSWRNPDPIRRHYFDSGANEGIAFYFEELMEQLGLFNNKPHTREIIYRFMRLRALRVDVDVNLALGNYTIEQAGKYLAKTVPMDTESAIGEAGFFALTPGQGISYQVGKIQILKLIADAKLLLGNKFSLKNYYDYMLDNGNVPIALQRWEYLGLKDQIGKIWPK